MTDDDKLWTEPLAALAAGIETRFPAVSREKAFAKARLHEVQLYLSRLSDATAPTEPPEVA